MRAMRAMRAPMSKSELLASGASREVLRKGVRDAHKAYEAPSVATSPLPRWESFALPDRHRLVGLLIQTARRQVPPGSTGRVRADQG
jgi:hypothetical protein